MLFKDYHLPLIRSGEKTVTRREWADGYARPTMGSIQIASTEMFTSDADADCYIRILDVFDQALGDMTDADARAEGDYEDVAAFREGYCDVYGEDAWDPEKVVAVVEFEYVGRERPCRDEHLVTDGGEDQDQTPREWVRERLEALTAPEPDGTQNNQGNVWASTGQLLNSGDKFSVPYDRSEIDAALDALADAGDILAFHGLVCPATPEHLQAVIANENRCEYPRKVLIEKASDMLQEADP